MKSLKLISTMIFILIISTFIFPVSAEVAPVIKIEQVKTTLPNVNTWFYYTADQLGGDVKATLAEESLNLTEVRKASGEDATHYYFLVDCSTSITYAQMEQIRRALTDFVHTKGENDIVNIISFGVQVSTLATNEKDNQTLINAINLLQPNQGGTVLFDALSTVTTLSSEESTALDRKMVFVFTDSVDYNLGGYTKEEVENQMINAGLPLYSFGFDHGSKESLDNLGALSRATGGDIAVTNMYNLYDIFMGHTANLKQNVWIAKFEKNTNIVPEASQIVELTLNEVSAQMQTQVKYWEKDETPPTVSEITQLSTTSFSISFSEPVLTADTIQSYTVIANDTLHIGVNAIQYDESTNKATLTIDELIGENKLKISFNGIVDISMEENLLSKTSTLDFIGAEEVIIPVEEELPTQALVGILVFIGAIIIIVAVVAVSKANKKRIEIMRQEQIEFENIQINETLASAVDTGKVHFIAGEVKNIVLEVVNANGDTKKVKLPINKTLFVGRSDICDAVFDDPQMSRQHFVIEDKGDIFVITNLSQTAATYLNGVAVQNPRTLNDGDVIEAASQRIIFRIDWGGYVQ